MVLLSIKAPCALLPLQVQDHLRPVVFLPSDFLDGGPIQVLAITNHIRPVPGPWTAGSRGPFVNQSLVLDRIERSSSHPRV
jgi:hypothetical protein